MSMVTASEDPLELTSKLSKPWSRIPNELDNDIMMILNLNKSGLVDEESLIKEDCVIEEIYLESIIRRRNSPKLCFFKKAPYIRLIINEFNGLYQILPK